MKANADCFIQFQLLLVLLCLDRCRWLQIDSVYVDLFNDQRLYTNLHEFMRSYTNNTSTYANLHERKRKRTEINIRTLDTTHINSTNNLYETTDQPTIPYPKAKTNLVLRLFHLKLLCILEIMFRNV